MCQALFWGLGTSVIKTEKNPYLYGAYVLVVGDNKNKQKIANYLICYKIISVLGKNRSDEERMRVLCW